MAEQCANPLLLGFIKEWLDRAKEFNSKGVTTYKKAYESMKACPIPFSHPSEAIVLSGLGPKICERLTEELRKHCAANGIEMPKVLRRRKNGGGTKRTSSEAAAADEADEAATTAATAPPKKRKTRPYVPMYRSGAYALLLALNVAGEGGGGEFLTKQQLTILAQPHCDNSFDAPSEPGKFYTAWSSMKTLMEKNLVYSRGNPKRYCLTEGGEEVARGIMEVGERGEGGSVAPTATAKAVAAGGSKVKATKKKSVRKIPVEPTEEARDVEERAALGASEDDLHTWGGGVQEEGVFDEPLHYGGLPAAQKKPVSDPRGPVLKERYTKLPYSRRQNEDLDPDQDSDDDAYTISTGQNAQRTRNFSQYKEPVRSSHLVVVEDLTGVSPSPSPPPPAPLRPLSKSGINVPRSSTTSKPLSYTAPIPYPLPSTSTSSAAQASPEAPITFPPFTPEVLKAGTFTVHLVLDNREVRSKTDRDYLQNSLRDTGIEALTRPLQVGDMLWVAREQTGQKREVVLDYIVERKRLDDLVSSIKDGRFHEQKFRLKKTSMKNVIYIIEDITLREADSTPAMKEAVETAISSTQVVNGFFVKRTAKFDDTIRYLVRMTKMIETIYATKNLSLIPTPLIDSTTFSSLQTHLSQTHPTTPFYITTENFSSLASKSASTTLRDVFLKMLMCVRGVSAEKALQMQRVFGTPAGLVREFELCRDEEERKVLIMRRCAEAGAVGRRKVGAAVSEKVAEVWGGLEEM